MLIEAVRFPHEAFQTIPNDRSLDLSPDAKADLDSGDRVAAGTGAPKHETTQQGSVELRAFIQNPAKLASALYNLRFSKSVTHGT